MGSSYVYDLDMDIITPAVIEDLNEEAFRRSVAKLREAKGWSQNRLAQELQEAGLSEYRQATVARLENGQRTLKLGEARVIASVLHTSVEEMISSPIIEFTNSLNQHTGILFDLYDEIRTLVTRYLQLEESAKTSIHQTIKEIDVKEELKKESPTVAFLFEHAYSQGKRSAESSVLDAVLEGYYNYISFGHQGPSSDEFDVDVLQDRVEELTEFNPDKLISLIAERIEDIQSGKAKG